MKKRLIAAFLAASMAFSAMPFAMADEGDVEISFKVGDSILLINGNPTEVETPYIAGEGTTLVPLRVITEAFGAQVDWEGETKTITLTYPDVNIVLQIDNIVAQVNDHSETLLEAPALSANGVTMVPLRFISETFGADVGYDNETSAILVTKKAIGNGQTVVGVTDMSRIGDDYYGWSIDNPQQMKMTDRRLDGLSTEFTADDDSKLYIDVYKRTKETLVPFDEEFEDIKDSFSDYTLTEAEKLTDEAGNKYMHFQAKDKEEIVDYREYYGPDMMTYEVVSLIKISDDAAIKNMILSIADSFKLGAINNETYNLSNVAGGQRTIRDDTYKFSLQIPADYYQSTSSEAENEFLFMSSDKDSNAYVSLDIYSKSADVTASALAYNDQSIRAKNANPQYSKISEVTETNGVYSYTHSISGSSKFDRYAIDTFFEKGEYVYNIIAVVDTLEDAPTASRIIGSLETEELDSAVVGKLLRNDPDTTTTATHEIGDYKITLPTSWKDEAGMSTVTGVKSRGFMDSYTTSVIAVTVMENDNITTGSLSSQANSYMNFIKEDKSNEIVEDIEYTTLNKQRYAYFTYKTTDKETGVVSYSTVYMKTSSKELVMITLFEHDIYYNASGEEIVKAAIESLTKE